MAATRSLLRCPPRAALPELQACVRTRTYPYPRTRIAGRGRGRSVGRYSVMASQPRDFIARLFRPKRCIASSRSFVRFPIGIHFAGRSRKINVLITRAHTYVPPWPLPDERHPTHCPPRWNRNRNGKHNSLSSSSLRTRGRQNANRPRFLPHSRRVETRLGK